MEINQFPEVRGYVGVSTVRKYDILFVIDDSGSMRQEQESLARNFPAFIRVLENVEGGVPSLHIGVVSSNVGTGTGTAGDGGGGPACAGQGDDGVLQVPDGCPPLTDGVRFIRHERQAADGAETVTNYQGSLEEQFACMAQIGTGGCGFEQHLESMRRALSNDGENAGFLRDDAFLAVIFVQDEDDCSARDRGLFDPSQDDVDAPLGELSSFRCFEFGTTCEGPADERATGPREGCAADEGSPYLEPVASYVEFLRGLKADPSRVIVAAITAGAAPVSVGLDPSDGPTGGQVWLEPQCVVCPGGGADCAPDDLGSALVAAAPAIRMAAFLDGFPQRATWQNICNYSPAEMDVDLSGALTQIALTFPIVPGDACLRDLAEPIDCIVSDTQHIHEAEQIETLIPPCADDPAARPCWELIPGDDCLRLEVHRDEDPPPGTTLSIRCLGA